MKSTDFIPTAPGRLVPTTALERMPNGTRQEVRGLAFVPNPLPPKLNWNEILGASWRVLADAERNVGLLEGKASRLTDARLLHSAFMRQEARLSSLIEDTVATPEEVVLAEAGQTLPRVEAHEVHNYLRALQYGWDSKLPLCGRLIKEMHALLLQGPRPTNDLPGEYRREQNYIGNARHGFARARFVPPPVAELEPAMRDLEMFMNAKSEDYPSLVGMALAHYQFEAIHPFRDGNGRLGRLLMVLWLRKHGLLSHPLMYVSAYLERHKDDYKRLLLEVSTKGAWVPWITFVLEAVCAESASAASRIENLLVLRSELIEKVTGHRRSSLCQKLIDHLFSHPAVTVKQVATVLKITDTAATNHINYLIEKGILEVLHPRMKPRLYLARTILDAASELED
jgi:Fic family protein